MKTLKLGAYLGVDGAMSLLCLHRHPAVGLLALTTAFGHAQHRHYHRG